MIKKGLMILGFILMSVSSQALEVGDEAPCVVLEHIQTNGQSSEHCIREPEFANKPIVLDFFSIYCRDCINSFPILNQMANETHGMATYRGIAVDRNQDKVKSFIEKNPDLIIHEVALDSARVATQAYGIFYTPTVFVIGTDNKILFKHEGSITDEIVVQIKQIIQSAK